MDPIPKESLIPGRRYVCWERNGEYWTTDWLEENNNEYCEPYRWANCVDPVPYILLPVTPWDALDAAPDSPREELTYCTCGKCPPHIRLLETCPECGKQRCTQPEGLTNGGFNAAIRGDSPSSADAQGDADLKNAWNNSEIDNREVRAIQPLTCGDLMPEDMDPGETDTEEEEQQLTERYRSIARQLHAARDVREAATRESILAYLREQAPELTFVRIMCPENSLVWRSKELAARDCSEENSDRQKWEATICADAEEFTWTADTIAELDSKIRAALGAQEVKK